MTVMYRTDERMKIEEYKITKSTEKSVWFVRGNHKRRELLKCSYYKWHNTWWAARACLIERELSSLNRARQQALDANDNLTTIENLPQPEGAL